jgi:site-specific DNA-methyltransferase (adenine-specific)
MEKSFSELGAGRSILVDKNGNIIAGNKSQKAAKAAGIKKVRIIETTGDELVAVKRTDIDIDSAEGRKMALLDNLTTQVNLAWDPSEIDAVSSEIEGFDPSDYGFDPSQLEVAGIGEGTAPATQSAETEAKEDDFDPGAEHYEPKVKRGEVWLLGRHRLMCGDSTDSECFAKLMNGERADIAFTSPPYNMQATNIAKAFDSDKVKDSYGIKEGTYNEFSDALSNEDYAKLLNGALDCCLAHSDEVLFNIGILAASKNGIIDMMAAHKDKFSDILVWNKNQCMPLCLPTQIHLLGHVCELIFCFSNAGTRAFSHSQWELGKMHNRIDVGKQNANEYSKIHHATFPVELPGYIIKWFTEKSVLDCFGGTGTTMIAAEQLGRKCYMMELDPHYCDVIIARWEKLTGEKARKAE